MAKALRYKPLHPDAERLRDGDLTPELRDALAQGPGALRALARAVAPDVYAIPALSPAYCAKLLAELHRREEFAAITGATLQRPNSMNRYGVHLEQVGLADLADDLLEQVGTPLGAALFPLVGTALDHHHTFTVEYTPEGDRELALHTDDAEVTLNVCLGDAFAGGDLRVLGRRCVAHAQDLAHADEDGTASHAVGQLLVHSGALRHLAEPVSSGRRCNLIQWCRSTRFRTAHGVPARCGPWCATR